VFIVLSVVLRPDTIPVSNATLDAIAARGVAVPTYDRTRLVPRIVHIGVGGFHRAHMALYTDELAMAGGDWGIRGIGLLAGDARMADVLSAQDHLYTLVERGGGPPNVRVVGSIVDYRLEADDPSAGAELLADPLVAVISLTITEAGYATGSATFDVVAAGLDRRRQRGHPPVSIVSCDNLPGNGDAARRATLAAAGATSPGLEAWTEQHCTFPNSMVDRITPVTSESDRAWLHEALGIDDQWLVVAEPFRQWVIEDAFAAGRPAWEDVGVLFTDRVHDWELYKLRLLNAGHSAIAYLAALAGITFVDEAMGRPEVRRFLDDLLYREAVPSLDEIPGHRREDYVASVVERFANTGIRDQIARLCIDGTAKYPTFLVPTIVHQLDHDGPVERAAAALAGWARYLATVPPAEQAFDASGDIARGHAHRALDDPTLFLQFGEVFPPALRDNARFSSAFTAAWTRIAEDGALAAMTG
jgi:mannitol 2-dehydrogenase